MAGFACALVSRTSEPGEKDLWGASGCDLQGALVEILGRSSCPSPRAWKGSLGNHPAIRLGRGRGVRSPLFDPRSDKQQISSPSLSLSRSRSLSRSLARSLALSLSLSLALSLPPAPPPSLYLRTYELRRSDFKVDLRARAGRNLERRPCTFTFLSRALSQPRQRPLPD